MNKILKVVLSILLFICLMKLPYGYYQFVRFFALISFLYLAYDSFKNETKSFAIIYLALALLFQPIFKISLAREIWNIIDVIIGIALIISIFIKPKSVK